MNATITATISNLTKGDVITVTTAKGAVTGAFVSVNSKGINVTVDGRTVSRSLTSITDLTTATPNTPADLFVDGMTYTTADVAAALAMSAYDLRVILRSLGMGVGKGHRYGIDAPNARTIVKAVRAGQTTTA
jgi:hypothetical protein